jgi:hypothetical protein
VHLVYLSRHHDSGGVGVAARYPVHLVYLSRHYDSGGVGVAARYPVAGISVNLGHPQGRALKSTLNFLGRIP